MNTSSTREKNLNRLGMTEEDIAAEIELSKKHIKENIEKIQQVFVELGYAEKADDVKLTIGPELEFTMIAGEESWDKRTDQIKAEKKAAKEKGEYPSFKINNKNISYMPPSVDVEAIDAKFSEPFKRLTKDNAKKAAHSVRTEFCAEPTIKTNIFSEAIPQKDAEKRIVDTNTKLLAASQMEFTFPPYSAVGAAEALNVMMNKVVQSVSEMGLERADFTALPNSETAVNSVHLNSVITVNGVNALSEKEWSARNPDNKKDTKPGTPSDLLMCIAKEHVDYLKHSLFMFARAESDYERYKREEVSGPSWHGTSNNKQHGNRATAMIRGEGRQTERLNSADPEKQDRGPLRFELRVPCPGAAGHPNKDAYPEQRIFPYQMIEAYTDMLAQGVSMWRERENERRNDQNVHHIEEAALSHDTLGLIDPEGVTLPHNKEIALSNFKNSLEAKAYWGDRMDTIIRLSDRLDKINEADRNPYTEKRGSHVERLLTTTAQPHAKENGDYRL